MTKENLKILCVIPAREGSTLKDCLGDICRSKKILLSSYDVTVGCPRKVFVVIFVFVGKTEKLD